MLLYSNRALFRIAFQAKGSVLFKRSSIGYGVLVFLVSLGAQIFFAQVDAIPTWFVLDTFGVSSLASAVTFSVVFRINLAWGRYWTAVSDIHLMYAKWGDAFSQFCAFTDLAVKDARSKDDNDSRQKVHRLKEMKAKVESYLVLMSILALEELHKGDCAQMEERDSSSSWAGRVVHKGTCRNNTGGTMPLPNLSCGSRSGSFRDKTYSLPRLPTKKMLEVLQSSDDRTEVVMHWVISCLSEIQTDLLAAPPIQSRMYQELSTGGTAFAQLRAIADVPFPFPFAQLLILSQILLTAIVLIFVTTNFQDSYILAPLVSLTLFQVPWCLTELATELENPLGSDMNDVDLLVYHERFASQLNVVARSSLHELEQGGLDDESVENGKEVADDDWIDVDKQLTAEQGSGQKDLNFTSISDHIEWYAIDRHLADISDHMERHLSLISSELRGHVGLLRRLLGSSRGALLQWSAMGSGFPEIVQASM